MAVHKRKMHWPMKLRKLFNKICFSQFQFLFYETKRRVRCTKKRADSRPRMCTVTVHVDIDTQCSHKYEFTVALNPPTL